MDDYWDSYNYNRPLPADGIKAKSKRGAIGEKWWSRRFIDALESLNLGGRLARGKTYARRGQVVDISIESGAVEALVQGSELAPYEVEIELTALDEGQWRSVEAVLAERAVYAAKLLAGEMPADIDDAFEAAGLSLLPQGVDDLRFRCSCPDWSNPCKHVAACLYILAEAFDDDPFLILQWRGRPKEDLLDNLRALRGSRPAAANGRAPDAGRLVPEAGSPQSIEDLVADFFSLRGRLEDVAVHPVRAPVPEAVLRRLAPSGIEVRGRPLEDVLGPAYSEMTAGAAEVAYAERDE